MQLYDKHILPRLTHLAMRQDQLLPYRRRAVSVAAGRVLEIGIGLGLNLALYPSAVLGVIGVDPSRGLLRLAADASRSSAPETELVEGRAEELSLEDRSVDCAIATWTLCSVSEPRQVLPEIRRVLSPGGIFSFAEHGLAPEPHVQQWQQWLTPIWSRCAGTAISTGRRLLSWKKAGFGSRGSGPVMQPAQNRWSSCTKLLPGASERSEPAVVRRPSP